MKRRFADKVIAITGASSGIGRATAIAFAREGARLAISARRAAQLDETAEAVRSSGGEAICVPGDVDRRADVDALVARAVEKWGALDIMVNNAGVGMRARVLETADADFEALFRTNVLGALHGMQAAASVMRGRGGVIVNVSSIVGKRAMPGNGAYCATKFALQALSDSLRIELVGSGIDVVVVCPGLTESEFHTAQRHAPAGGLPRRMPRMSAERCADELLDATARHQRERILTVAGKAVLALDRASPALADRVLRVVMRDRL
jgi:NAD(P)-dependent dehydrogenase (short-subunit alcohol dehydrogenase family)